MSEKEFNEMRKKLVQNVTNAAEAWLAYMCTDGAVAAIPNTDPQQYVVAGTMKMISKVLPNVEATLPTVRQQADLTLRAAIEKALEGRHIEDGTVAAFDDVVDAIEREVRLSAVREARNWQPIATVPMDGSEVLLYLQAPFNRVAKARWFDVWENWIEGEFPDPQDEYCGIGSRVPTHWMHLPEAPAASKEGGEHV
jgi:hypothetical protein